MQAIYKADPQKIIIGMVGLPARGKSYISKKIYRYLNWLGFNTQVFNIGNFRRKYLKETNLQLNSEFFDPSHKEFSQIREYVAEKTMEQLVDYINKPQKIVAIFDGTNTTTFRRKKFAKYLQENVKTKYQLIWIESVCDNQQILSNNIRTIKIHGLDYMGMDPEQAELNFRERIQMYKKVYCPLSKQQNCSYFKITNVGEGIESHKIIGYLPEKIMAYVMKLTISPQRVIYLSRHGESQYNLEDRIGGNPELSKNGQKYKDMLPLIFKEPMFLKNSDKTIVLTSTLKRTKQTALKLNINQKQLIQLRILDEINAGICEEMTYEQIADKYPDIAEQREVNKLKYRYPSGESYLDLISRLQPLMCWIQRQKYPIIIFSHQAVLRCIYGYLFGVEIQQIPYIKIPLHTLIKMVPQTYSFKQENICADIESDGIRHEIQTKKKYSIDLDGEGRFEQINIQKISKIKSAQPMIYKPQMKNKQPLFKKVIVKDK